MATKAKPKAALKPKRLTKAERAVAIAKDVIRQLRYMRVYRGVYIGSPDSALVSAAIKKAGAGADLRDILPVVRNNCYVCAKGACLIAKAHFFDSVPISDVFDANGRALPAITGDSLTAMLSDCFSARTINLIEAAFEGWDRYATDFAERGRSSDAAAAAAENFGKRFINSKERLRAIMLNVIKNNGEFKPGVK